MRYTQEEKEKIHNNLDAIKSYIEEYIQPNISDSITVDFGEIKTYYAGDREREFHLYVYPDHISGRSGGLGLSFDKNEKGSSTSSTIYVHLDYAVELIRQWRNIKSTLHTAVDNEIKTRNLINDFEV